MAEADSRTGDLITRRTFSAASTSTAPEYADGRALTGAAHVYAFYPPPLETVRHSPKPGLSSSRKSARHTHRARASHRGILALGVPAMPSIGHPDDAICAHLTTKHENIVKPGLLSNTGTS
jgi:hypothetical protein